MATGLPVTILGTGVQARSHLPVLAHLLPGADLTLCGRDAARAEALATEVRSGAFGDLGEVRSTTDADGAVQGAALVITLVSFGPATQSVSEASFAPDATIVAADYDMCVPASIAAGAALFLTDDRGQFLANRTATRFRRLSGAGRHHRLRHHRWDAATRWASPGHASRRRPGRCRLR